MISEEDLKKERGRDIIYKGLLHKNSWLWGEFASHLDSCPDSAIDVQMLPIVKEFNKIAGVVTRYCCEGHGTNDVDKPYLMMACDTNGLSSLVRIMGWIHELSSPYLSKWSLEITYAVYTDEDGCEFWYPSATLRCKYVDTLDEIQKENELLLEAVRLYNRS